MGAAARGSRGRMGASFAAFTVTGLYDGAIGVAWPSMRADLHRPLSALGLVFICSTVGFLITSLSIGRILPRTGFRAAIVPAMVVYACGLTLVGFAPWPGLLLGALLLGLSVGVTDGGVNLYSTLRMSGGGMQFLHGSWGVGSLLGPLLVTALLLSHQSWRLTFATVALLELALALVLVLGPAWPRLPRAAAATRSRQVTLSAPFLVGVAAFLVYTGAEAAAGAWSYSVLTQSRGVSAALAGLLVSAYWLGLTAGRMAGGIAGLRIPSRALVLMGVSLTVAASLLFWLGPGQLSAAVALPLLGLGLAPIYPALMTLTVQRVPQASVATGVGFQTAAAGAGSAFFPAGAGLAMQGLGLGVFGPLLAGSCLVLAGLSLLEARLAGAVRQLAP